MLKNLETINGNVKNLSNVKPSENSCKTKSKQVHLYKKVHHTDVGMDW